MIIELFSHKGDIILKVLLIILIFLIFYFHNPHICIIHHTFIHCDSIHNTFLNIYFSCMSMFWVFQQAKMLQDSSILSIILFILISIDSYHYCNNPCIHKNQYIICQPGSISNKISNIESFYKCILIFVGAVLIIDLVCTHFTFLM